MKDGSTRFGLAESCYRMATGIGMDALTTAKLRHITRLHSGILMTISMILYRYTVMCNETAYFLYQALQLSMELRLKNACALP